MELARLLNDDSKSAELLLLLANAHYSRNPEQAWSMFERAREAYDLLADHRGQANCLLSMATLAFRDGRNKECLDLARKAIDRFAAVQDGAMVAVCKALQVLVEGVGDRASGDLLVWSATASVFEASANEVAFVSQPGYTCTQFNKMDKANPLKQFAVFYRLGRKGKIIQRGAASGYSDEQAIFSYTGLPLRARLTIDGYEGRADVPAGDFSSCLVTTLDIQNNQPDDLSREASLNRDFMCSCCRAWYAPGVGLARAEIHCLNGVDATFELASYAVSSSADDYFPLAVGNRWEYVWAGLADTRLAREIYEVTGRKDETWYVASTTYGYDLKDAGHK
jgi:hypothetical protein